MAGLDTPGCSIDRLLSLRGNKKLKVIDEVTETILEKTAGYPGIHLRFLETKKCEGWNEYYPLLEVTKDEENPLILSVVLEQVAQLIRDWNLSGVIDTFGIQEIKCEESGYYYFLFYIIKERKS